MIAELKGHKDKLFSVAVRPSDSMIASGDASGEIRLWDGNTGHYLRTLANQVGLVGNLSSSRDAHWLLSTCGYRCIKSSQQVWDVATGKELVAYTKHDNIVIAADMSPDDRLAATGGGNNHEIHIWDVKTGETKRVLSGTGAPSWSVGFSADRQHIAWGNTSKYSTNNDRGPLQYQLRLPVGPQPLGQPEPVIAATVGDFMRARASYGVYTLSHREGGAFGMAAILDLKKDGQAVASIERSPVDGYQHRSYSFTPDGQTIISAGDSGHLIAYDLKGQKIGEFVGHESDVMAVTPSPDGRLLVSGSGDQTVRLWNLKSRELIVTLVRGTDGEWVMWTPQGYYTGSPGADRIVGWQINKGPDQAADYVGADQLRQHLNRPDIVEKAIILASAEQAVREAPGTVFKLADLLARPVPRFKIMSPRADDVQRGGRAVVRIAIEATPDRDSSYAN